MNSITTTVHLNKTPHTGGIKEQSIIDFIDSTHVLKYAINCLNKGTQYAEN